MCIVKYMESEEPTVKLVVVTSPLIGVTHLSKCLETQKLAASFILVYNFLGERSVFAVQTSAGGGGGHPPQRFSCKWDRYVFN